MYIIRAIKIKRWHFWHKFEWFIENENRIRLGPFDSYNEALEVLAFTMERSVDI